MATRQRNRGTSRRSRRQGRLRQADRRQLSLQLSTERLEQRHFDLWEGSQGDADEADDSSGLVPWETIATPYFDWPLLYTHFPVVPPPFGPYEPFGDEDDLYDVLDYFGYYERNKSDESALNEYIEALRELEDTRFSQHSPRHGRDEIIPQREESGMGEPTYPIDEDEPMPSVDSDGSGDSQVDLGSHGGDVWQSLQEMYNGPVVTNYGTVSFILKHGMRVDITMDYAVRVVNFTMHCTAAIDGPGDRSCVCHPCGRAIQEGVNVDIAYGTRLAKISSRGVTFTALNHGLVYLVDASGTKSTTERFHNLGYDIPMSVFYSQAELGMDIFEDCFDLISRVRQRTTDNGDEVWVVNGVRIKQTAWGDVQVSRDSGRRVIWSSPTAGTISVTTPLVKMAVTCDPTRYFFVRAGQKRISGTWDGFTVRNGSQRAGFDHRGRLTLP
ncbi:uncharacterized protein LOC144167477 [Haemaphysalis longicornis]